MDTATPLQGRMLAFRLGDQIRTGVAYTSVEMQFRTYARHAALHDGKLLFARGVSIGQPADEQLNQIIVFSRNKDIALYGRIVGRGLGYDPVAWDKDDPYQMPEPQNGTPARKWYKLKDVRLIRIDLNDFTTMIEGRRVSLRDAAEMSGRSAYAVTTKHWIDGTQLDLSELSPDETGAGETEGTLKDRTAVIIRAGGMYERLGFETVKLDIDGIESTVRYNQHDAPTFRDVCTRHARKHGGRIIIPFGANMSMRNLNRCGRFYLVFMDGAYLTGRIAKAGSPWIPALQDERYSAPKGLRVQRERLWVRLDDLTYGERFDPDGWNVYTVTGGGRKQPLAERMATSRNSSCIAVKGV